MGDPLPRRNEYGHENAGGAERDAHACHIDRHDDGHDRGGRRERDGDQPEFLQRLLQPSLICMAVRLARPKVCSHRVQRRYTDPRGYEQPLRELERRGSLIDGARRVVGRP